MTRILWLAITLISVALQSSTPLMAADQKLPPLPPDAIEVTHCELEFELSTLVGANTGLAGSLTVQDALVQLGDKVKAGQVLGRLNDLEVRARLALLQELATSDIDIRVAESRMKEATLSLKRVDNLRSRSKSYTSDDEYGRIRVEAETATLQMEQARQRREVAKLECLEVKAQVRNREIISPHDGTVVEIFKKVGETITANEPMYSVVNTEIIRVIGNLNLEQYGRVSPGQEIRVYPETDELNPDKKNSQVAVGKVIFVDRRVDPKTRTIKVVAQIINAGSNLPSGIEARMVILPTGLQTKSEPAPATAAAASAVTPPAVSTTTTPSAKAVPAPSELSKPVDLSDNPLLKPQVR